MLMGLKRPLKQGDAFPLFLTFAHAGQIAVRVLVRAAGEEHMGGPMDGQRMGSSSER